METINIEEVLEDDRQRKEYNAEKISQLADSIQDAGLLHAIRIRSLSDPTLVAGGRRLRALRLVAGRGHQVQYGRDLLPLGVIPVTVHHSSDTYDLQLAELYENIHREDITWQEQTAAVARLHSLRVSKNPKHTVTDTSKELFGDSWHSSSGNKTSESIRIAAAVEADPALGKLASIKEVKKAIAKKATNEVFADLAGILDDSNSEHTLLLGAAGHHMRQMDSGRFSCILTDPPYGIGADTFGDQGQGTHAYDDSQEHYHELMRDFADESFRVTADEAHAYIFFDLRHFAFIREQMADAGWYVWPTPIIWYKGNQGLLPRPSHAPRRCYEAILFCIKGDKKVILEGKHDVITINGAGASRHAAEKPVELYVDLLQRSCRPGDEVLDPFAGSGPIFPAANKLNLTATGINLNEEDYNLALTRLGEK